MRLRFRPESHTSGIAQHFREVLKKDLLNSFAPKSPDKWKKNPNEWLSSLDIIQVMNQYEKKYKGFKFFGAVPMDFASLKQLEIANVDYNKLYENGIRKLGIVFNLVPYPLARLIKH